MSKQQSLSLKQTITDIRKSLNLVGLGGAIMHRGELQDIAVDGLRRLNGEEFITPNDKWCVGSIGKSMTATMIGRLVDKDLCSFETELGEVFTSPEHPIHENWKPVTLEQLLTQRSGAKPNFPLKRLKEAFELNSIKARQEHRLYVIEKMLSSDKALGKKDRFLYSNFGYSIAGVTASLIMQKPYEDLMQDEVFAPLGMTSVVAGAPTGDNPWGHQSGWFSRKPIAPEYKYSENALIVAPAGRWTLSLEDLVKFGYEHIKGRSGASSLMSKEIFERLHAPVGKHSDYAYGWVVTEIEGEQIIWHNGCNTMWYAILWLIPEHDTAVAFTTNQNMSWKIDRRFMRVIKEQIKILRK